MVRSPQNETCCATMEEITSSGQCQGKSCTHWILIQVLLRYLSVLGVAPGHEPWDAEPASRYAHRPPAISPTCTPCTTATGPDADSGLSLNASACACGHRRSSSPALQPSRPPAPQSRNAATALPPGRPRG